jgi:hypothetical protein
VQIHNKLPPTSELAPQHEGSMELHIYHVVSCCVTSFGKCVLLHSSYVFSLQLKVANEFIIGVGLKETNADK